MAHPDPEARFSDLFRLHSRALLGYALRRVEHSHDAADVVAETMLVAWRRLADVPEGDETRPWLFGVARMVLLNHHRSQRRSTRLAERLKASLADVHVPDPAQATGEQALVRAALTKLGEEDRELLRLTAWEGLEPGEIAVALSLLPATVRTRLHRARMRLRRQLELDGWDGERSAPPGHEGDEGRPLAQRTGGRR